METEARGTQVVKVVHCVIPHSWWFLEVRLHLLAVEVLLEEKPVVDKHNC